MYLSTEPVHNASPGPGNTVADKTINLIIIDDSFDSEERIVSSLRSVGYTARSVRAEDEEDLVDAIAAQVPELVIYFTGMELISLQQTCECLAANEASQLCHVIAVDKAAQSSVVEVMRAGAVDLVAYDNIDHLLLVISREHRALVNARKNSLLDSALEETEKRCNSLLDSSRDAIAYIHEGMHIYSNQSYLELFGLSASDELEGLPVLDMVAEDQRETFKAFLRDYARKNTGVEALQTQLRKPNGEEFEGAMELSPAHIDNEPCIQIVIRQNNANSEELEKQLKLLSQKDQLTGLYNRQHFIEVLEDVIAHCEQGEYTAVMMQIQLDNFDNIKNTLGIADSDKYIVAAAETLNAQTGDKDILARYTHYTFTYITYNCDTGCVEKLAEKFQHAISELIFDINDQSINTTCSIGATLIDTDTPEYNNILNRAEKALEDATSAGVNQLCLHQPEKGELTRHEVDARFKEQLTNALKNDDFILHFQPVISLHGDTNERYEVFVRLRNTDESEDTLIMPQDFLPAAERIGMAIAIDRWVLYQTITEMTRRWESGHKTRFFLKLSAASLKDETLIDWLTYQSKEKKLPPDSLAFVVKENIAVTNLKHAKALSQQLKKLNCGFILDDFGSGSNPFQLLQHIHADYVRIDPSFMEDLTENTQHQDHIRKIAEKAAELNKLTIAQHVPDATSLSILWGMGVNFIQGNFLQEPAAVMDYDFTEMSG
ncbi:MAG TPA: EAL domain-containing protein [Thiotrichales bacterium]|nr:EAL domain-containing protein [Thiotrichales bacterium]